MKRYLRYAFIALFTLLPPGQAVVNSVDVEINIHS